MAGRAVRLYNSLTRRIETLEPVSPRDVGIYTCGPTVYQYAHVGNLRSFLFADVLRRTLQYAGYSVRHVKNITDVGHMRNDDDAALTSEDRVEQAALGEGKTPEQIADYYTEAWLEDEALINILPADVMPKASDHISAMIDLIMRLLDSRAAYEVDGAVYFDVSAFPRYIAQSEAALGHPTVSVWMHGEFLTVSDAKMAKSVGNVFRIADLQALGYEPLAFRYLALTAHYRSKLDFTADAMHAAASGLDRLRRAVAAGADADGAPVGLSAELLAAFRHRFIDAVVDDLGLPKALAIAHEVASAADLTKGCQRALLVDFDRVLGLSLDECDPTTPESLPEGAGVLLERRSAARAKGDWTTSDRLREELAAKGVEVRDKPDGTFEAIVFRAAAASAADDIR